MSQYQLTPECFRLLQWFSEQTEPMGHSEFWNLDGIGYSDDRLGLLFTRGLLARTTGSVDGNDYGWMYYITDDGKLALQHDTELKKQDAKQAKAEQSRSRRETIQTISAVLATIVAILSFSYSVFTGYQQKQLEKQLEPLLQTQVQSQTPGASDSAS